MFERDYQAHIIKKLRQRFPACMILKNDASYLQGIPDLLILHMDRWAMLEVKRSPLFAYQPNQLYYIDLLNDMSFAAFIYPENEDLVLDDLQHAFSARRPSRISER